MMQGRTQKLLRSGINTEYTYNRCKKRHISVQNISTKVQRFTLIQKSKVLSNKLGKN